MFAGQGSVVVLSHAVAPSLHNRAVGNILHPVTHTHLLGIHAYTLMSQTDTAAHLGWQQRICAVHQLRTATNKNAFGTFHMFHTMAQVPITSRQYCGKIQHKAN
jgi:hypothetical protein